MEKIVNYQQKVNSKKYNINFDQIKWKGRPTKKYTDQTDEAKPSVQTLPPYLKDITK